MCRRAIVSNVGCAFYEMKIHVGRIRSRSAYLFPSGGRVNTSTNINERRAPEQETRKAQGAHRMATGEISQDNEHQRDRRATLAHCGAIALDSSRCSDLSFTPFTASSLVYLALSQNQGKTSAQ